MQNGGMAMVGKIRHSSINILKEEGKDFFDLIDKLLSTYKVSNDDKVKLNIMVHEGKDWLLSFQKQNHILMNTWKFQEEIDIQLYSLFNELNIIKNRLYSISDKYKVHAEEV
jgi:sulfite reductase alpha subunit-like flavoprotein